MACSVLVRMLALAGDTLLPTRVTDPEAIIASLDVLNSSSFDKTVPARGPSGLLVGGTYKSMLPASGSDFFTL